MCVIHYHNYDVVTGSEISTCNKIDKPLMVYILSGNVMLSIIKQYFTAGMRFQGSLNVIFLLTESNIRAIVLLKLNSLHKRDKMLGKPRILSLLLNSF